MQILIVEDSRQMRRMIRSVVARFAEEILECEEGDAAVTLYQANRPDWVLMDIRLKGSDGVEAARRICTLDPAAQVVMVTDYDDNGLRTAAAAAGSCGYVLKENLLELHGILAPR